MIKLEDVVYKRDDFLAFQIHEKWEDKRKYGTDFTGRNKI